ncbi:MAG: hypothetical protein U0S48_17785 [Solirubrobacteraceae bacterium]
MPPPQRDDRYQPLALIGVTLIALLGFAVFFLSFLVAPLAILLVFYVGFAIFDRSHRRRTGNGKPATAPPERRPSTSLSREAQGRRDVLDQADAQEPPIPR